MSKKCYFLLSQHFFAFFWDFKCIYLVNGMSDSIKPIHIYKSTKWELSDTVFKNITVEKNDVISKMADFAIFGLKKANISWTIHPIMTNHTIFSSLNQALFDSVTHFSAFGHPKIDAVRVPPLNFLNIGYYEVIVTSQMVRHISDLTPYFFWKLIPSPFQRYITCYINKNYSR